MHKAIRVIAALAFILSALFGVLVVAPSQAQAQVVANHIVYNLYATDGWATLADGTPQYGYGFVGGRASVNGVAQPPISVINSQKPVAGVVPAMTVTPGVTIFDPTGGPVTAAEKATFQGKAQFPAPVIYAAVGDVVEIRLKNLGVTEAFAPNDPHSVHLHGLDVDAANDGVPETSVGAIPGNLCADGRTEGQAGTLPGCAQLWPVGTPGAGTPVGYDPSAGNVVVYMFKADYPGTYMYHCHQEASIHVQMGMYGALVVYNPADAAATVGPGKGAGGNLYGWQYDKDYILLLGDVDTRQHKSEQNALKLTASSSFNPATYKPQYWLINGMGFPNTIHVNTMSAGLAPVALFNWTNWIAAHPNYDPFVVGSVSTPHMGGTPGDKVLVRMINMGFEQQPMHVHGFHFKVIGSDARAWKFANDPALTPFNQGLEKNTISIGSGETYDLLFDFGQQRAAASYAPAATDRLGIPLGPSTFPGGTQSRNSAVGPVSNTQTTASAIIDPFQAPAIPPTTYIGGPVVGPAPGGALQSPALPPTTGQYFPWHNHDDYKATNNGVYPGGMFTMVMTQP